jgi:hypothetical protein
MPSAPSSALASMVFSLQQQSQAMARELHAAQDEACTRLEAELRAKERAEEALAEAAALREEAERLRGELVESEKGRLAALTSSSGSNAT